MKNFLMIGIFLFVCGINIVYSMSDEGKKNISGTSTTIGDDDEDDEDDEILLVLKGSKPIVYSLSPTMTKAYLSEQILKIYFQEISSLVSIVITDISTDRVVYRTDCNSIMMIIDLKMLEEGSYQLDIMSEDEWLQGEFTL